MMFTTKLEQDSEVGACEGAYHIRISGINRRLEQIDQAIKDLTNEAIDLEEERRDLVRSYHEGS